MWFSPASTTKKPQQYNETSFSVTEGCFQAVSLQHPFLETLKWYLKLICTWKKALKTLNLLPHHRIIFSKLPGPTSWYWKLVCKLSVTQISDEKYQMVLNFHFLRVGPAWWPLTLCITCVQKCHERARSIIAFQFFSEAKFQACSSFQTDCRFNRNCVQ